MSNTFTGAKPDEGITPPSSVKGPIKVVGLVVGITLIVCAIMYYWFVGYRYEASGNSGSGKPAAVTETPAPFYEVRFEVGNRPVRIPTPFGYKVSDCHYDIAPLQTRSSDKPEWIDTGTHIEGSNMDAWREWRIDPRYDGDSKKAKVYYKFTKVF